MTRYVINRFAEWKLPVFHPDWRKACESCIYCRRRTAVSRDGGDLDSIYCTNGAAKTSQMTACIDARTRACGPDAKLRKERIA